MNDTNKRRFLRLDVALPVELRGQRQRDALLTGNISRTGVFIRTPDPPPERQLLKLHFYLPDQSELEVTGMVVRSVTDEESETGAGMGIHFFALSKEDRSAWDRFCLELERRPYLQRKIGDVSPSAAGGEPSGADELPTVIGLEVTLLEEDTEERRHQPRYAARFEVLLPDTDALRVFYTRDISAGGTFVRTEHLRRPDDVLEIILVHPENGKRFGMPARVARVVDNPPEGRGMALVFELLDTARQQELEIFVGTGLEALGAEVRNPLDSPVIELVDVVELDTRTPRAHASLGQALLEQMEDPAAAIEALNKALEIDPEYLPAHRHLRLAYALLGDKESALKHLRIARRLENSLRIPF